jgi:hypothetical protein
MKDIYIIMAHQNILAFYSRKLDIRVDKSQYFDYQPDNEEKYDIRIDNSEYYDFELDYTPDYELVLPNIPKLYLPTISISSEGEYLFLTENGEVLMSEGLNKLQYQF